MDKRSWLWRKKTSEKSTSGEAESSGSISSHSERFSDDQALSYHNAQSPEVTSTAGQEEEDTDTVKALSEKLSEALLNIQLKEDLVKQHAKVAEEAVSGWEKAETEAVALKKQVEILTQKNSVLEERISYLDEALKECLRQLRHAREEQEQKIHDTVSQKNCEWESTKSELENRLVQLQTQLGSSGKNEATMVSDLRAKLEAADRENSVLVLQIHSIREELKLLVCERDLSTQAAETASKQHLDSIKKVAKLEAECRRLKAVARRAAPADNDHRSGTASLIYVESFTDSQSDNGDRLSATEKESCKINGAEMNDCEPSNSDSRASTLILGLDHFKRETPPVRNLMSASVEINLMDDFLEMERLVALPQTETGIQTDLQHQGEEISFKAELEAMINRTAELEEKLETLEAEKTKLEISLDECENELKTSKDQLKVTESKLEDLKTKLVMETKARRAAEATNTRLRSSMEHLDGIEARVDDLQTQLAITNEGKHKAEAEVEATNKKLGKFAEKLKNMEAKLIELQRQLAISNEEKHTAEVEVEATKIKLKESKEHMKEMEVYLADLQNQLASSNEAKRMAELEVEATNLKLNKSTERLAELEAYMADLQNQLATTSEAKHRAEVELETSFKNNNRAESQLKATELEMQTLESKIGLLKDEVQRERALANEAVVKCQKLENEVSRFSKYKREANIAELKINQDKELAVAANKFSECQKTMASLSQQLKSLATLDDFLLDTER